MSKDLIILRGLPGSGKSEFAKVIGQNICSTDDYMYNENGEYVWTEERVNYAHQRCQRKCETLMMIRCPKIIIANTNILEEYMNPYYDLAEKHGYKVYSVIVENRHGGINSHAVDEQTIQLMKSQFQIKL